MNRFQEWKITTKATLIASAVAATVAAGVASGGDSETKFRQTAAVEEGTTSTSAPVTTSVTEAPTTSTTAATVSTTSTSSPTTSSSTTTTTAAPAMTVDVVLGSAVNDASGTRVPVTVTVKHGTANVMVCLSSTIVEQGTPYHGGLPFWDVSGTQTLDWVYQYAGQHIADVQIVKKLVDSRYGCMP